MIRPERYYRYKSSLWTRLARQASYGIAIWLALTVFYSLTHYYLLGRFIISPPLRDLLVWQAAGQAPWIVMLPLIVWLAARIPLANTPYVTGILAHTGIALALTIVHMFWFGFVSAGIPTYAALADMSNALNHFVRYVFIVDLLIYAVLVAMTVSMSLQGFTATQEGLLKSSGLTGHRDAYLADPPGMSFEGRHAPVLVFDPDTRWILAVNSACVDAYGYPASTLVTKTLDDITDAGALEDFLSRLDRAKHMSLWLGNTRHVRADGGVMEAEYIGQPVRFSGERAMMLLVNDVTEEVRASRELEESERRASELRVQLADARLRALKLQLKPHFLFNLLNTVSMMIRNRDYDQAQQVVTLLGDMFRSLLDIEEKDSIELGDELKIVENYLELQRYRFEERIDLHDRIDRELLDARVPAMVLQPVVENAVKHGVAHTSGPCRIDFDIHEEDGTLVVELTNDCTPEAVQRVRESGGRGIGVSNTHARLQAVYGDRAAFELVPLDGRVRATLHIPLERNGAGV